MGIQFKVWPADFEFLKIELMRNCAGSGQWVHKTVGGMTDWLLTLEYEQEVAEKSRADYDPYSHVYESEPFLDVETLEKWEWEEE